MSSEADVFSEFEQTSTSGGGSTDAFDEGVEEIEASPSGSHKPTSPDAAASSSSSSSTDATEDMFAGVDNTNTPGPSFDSFSNIDEVKEEETPLSQWESERKIILAERQQKAEDTKHELLAAAKEDLNKFYADQKVKLEKTQKTNRADEKNYKQDMKQLFETGNRWEKVNKLVNTLPKASEKPGTSRVERFRKLLIQMKTVKDKEEKKSAF